MTMKECYSEILNNAMIMPPEALEILPSGKNYLFTPIQNAAPLRFVPKTRQICRINGILRRWQKCMPKKIGILIANLFRRNYYADLAKMRATRQRMNKQKVVLDANVLYGNFSWDLLLSLFAAEMYEAKWSEKITQEWVGHLLAHNKNVNEKNISRTVKLMNAIPPAM